jgi:hypothetical protein
MKGAKEMLKWERSKERFDCYAEHGKVSCKMEDMKPYSALPCEIDDSYKYFLNDVQFDTDDFGEKYTESDGNYGCCDAHFEGFDDINKDTLKKYNIDEDEYRQIEEYLVEILYVGSCGWCV